MAERDARLIGGTYRVTAVMNASGMLTTCTASDLKTHEMVGLFLIEFPPHFHAQTVQHLLSPLERRRSLQSSHVLHIHDWGVDGNRAYIATDSPRGVTLRHVLNSEYVNLRRGLDLVRQLLHGVLALHMQGITGLDLRPQLITVEALTPLDHVQLDDIGIRSLLNALGYVSMQSSEDIGYLDPHYAPPEYLNGEQIGAWSDIYQIGLLLFELVTGRLPFIGRDATETAIMQSSSPVPRMNPYNQDTTASLQALVDRALAKVPTERFPSVAALLAALNEVQLSPRITQMIPTLGNTGFTKEIPQVDEDLSLIATVIDTRDAAQQRGKPIQPIPTEDGIYAYLCYEKDGIEQKIALNKAQIVVGRLDPKRNVVPDIDLSMLDPNTTVSRRHARIRFEENRFYIEDLRSVNKTRLREIPLMPSQKTPLQHGDSIRFGGVRVIFKLP